MNNPYTGKVGFVVGTGRCGTYLACKLMSLEREIAACHERSVFAECFHRYCKWYGVDVDDAVFIQHKKSEIDADLERHQFSFEASAPLSLSIHELYKAFDAYFVLLVRSPERVINSYMPKGWYREDISWTRHDSAPGYQPGFLHHHHLFGRIMPYGEDYKAWGNLGRIGKLAWFWSTLNTAVIRAFEALPADRALVLRLEDFDYASYVKMLAFYGLASTIPTLEFKSIAASRPNNREALVTTGDWTARDIEEFEKQIGPIAGKLGYLQRFSDYPPEAPSGKLATGKAEPTLPLVKRLNRSFRRAARSFVDEMRTDEGRGG